MRRYRATKIAATLGPSSSSPEVIEQLFLSGVDVFRLNFSHGSHTTHKNNYDIIRELEKKYQRPIGIMQDLQGPKLRVGDFQDKEVTLVQGATFCFDMDSNRLGDKNRVSLPHPEIFQAVREGSILLLNDGRIRLQVTTATLETIQTEVLVGGELSNHKGLNVPGVVLPISPITEKDRKDLDFGLSLGVDWVALSFVQKPEDIIEARTLIEARAGIIAKIEKPLAVQHIKEIIKLSDAIMIARGDLGVELMPEDVPSVQKQIVRECRAIGRPVIVATQMLETMVTQQTPTRAEASDVACAVYDGVDAVMLSAETAAGKHPVDAVTIMNRIIERVEGDPFYRKILETSQPVVSPNISDAITAAARNISDTLSLKAIVTITTSGTTTLRAARERPNAPIIGVTPDRLTAHILTLTWGAHAIQLSSKLANKPLPEIMDKVCAALLTDRFAEVGEDILVTVGAQFNQGAGHQVFRPGTTKGLFILKIEDSHQKSAITKDDTRI